MLPCVLKSEDKNSILTSSMHQLRRVTIHRGRFRAHQYFNLTLLRSYTSITCHTGKQKGSVYTQHNMAQKRCGIISKWSWRLRSMTRERHLQSLVCGIEQQFNPILSQVQYEVVAEWCLEGEINRYLKRGSSPSTDRSTIRTNDKLVIEKSVQTLWLVRTFELPTRNNRLHLLLAS